MHLVVTDSGLGGLAVCAGLERALRRSARERRVRLTYVNAWPEEGRGYNDLPDPTARARVFDVALSEIDRMAPEAVLIACNTLSILYGLTSHSRRGAKPPVHGIVEAGVSLFADALGREPSGAIVLTGTRTTIESAAHRSRLSSLGVDGSRIAGVSCHGLATAIEDAPSSQATEAAIASCVASALRVAPAGEPLFLGLCCTHYGMVGDRFGAALDGLTGRDTRVLDPNVRLVDELADRFGGGPPDEVSVEVVSKVSLSDGKREGIAALLDPVSPVTARALRHYVHEPGLF